MSLILDIFMDALIDSLKLIPFLFVTYLIMEYIEHKTNKKTENLVKQSGKFGPLIGGILGVFPQCGFSAAASNLYSNKLISVGTLIAIFLSTSDEMLPIFISESVELGLILKVLFIKLIVAIIFGFLVDILLGKLFKIDNSNKLSTGGEITHMCEDEKCGCDEHGIILSSLKHTLNIFVYIFIVTILINGLFELIGRENMSNLITNIPILGPVIAGIIGLIPNCASSVVLTKLYLTGGITISTLLSGLLVGSGVGILILFKSNKNVKENIKIISVLYIIGVLVGIFFELIKLNL